MSSHVDAVDEAVATALDASHLAVLTDGPRDEVLTDARCLEVPAGSTLHREGDTAAHCEMVVSGLVRVFVTAPDGRTMTVRYCRPGGLLGVASIFHRSFILPASIQAVTDVRLLALRPETVEHAADRHPEVAHALLAELSERAMAFAAEIPGGVFATVPQRVARHLLDLASATQQGSELVARVGQRELADAVGSVREVVVRALRDFRHRGLIRTQRGRVVIVAPERLLDEAWRCQETDRFWNLSRRHDREEAPQWIP